MYSDVLTESAFYRPLQAFTHMVDYSLWKLNPSGYHAMNIFLHILASLSLYWLVNIIFQDKLLSFFTAILFVVHPIHTEAITYISGRADPMALLFMLISFIFYIKYLKTENVGTYLLIFLSYTLALLSKENSLILPVLLLLYHFSFKKRIKLKAIMPFVILVTCYLGSRLILLKSATIHISKFSEITARIPGFFAALGSYLKLLVLPFGLHVDYGNRLFSFSSWKPLSGLIILTCLLVYAGKKRNSNNLVFFSISWFFLGLLPVSNIFFPLPFYLAEHYLYLPSIGFFLILAKLLTDVYRIKKYRLLVKGLVVFLLVFYSHLTIKQNRYWNNPFSLFQNSLKYEPQNPRSYNNLGIAYADAGKTSEAISCFLKVLEIKPDHLRAQNNLGLQYAKKDKHQEAIALFKKVTKTKPNYSEAYNNLGSVYLAKGEVNQAIATYKKALEINPDYALAHNNLGVAYHYKKDYDLAGRHFNKAIKLGYKVNPKLLKPSGALLKAR
jgi:tetratricopeptide (TPR) repeat protein